MWYYDLSLSKIENIMSVLEDFKSNLISISPKNCLVKHSQCNHFFSEKLRKFTSNSKKNYSHIL